MNNIGKTIAELRKNNNMTQSEVADQLGISYQAVSKWEREESLPDITLLPQIADLFHVSIDDLVRGKKTSEKVHIINQEDKLDQTIDAVIDSQINNVTNLVNQAFIEGIPSADELSERITNYFTQHFASKFETLAPFMKPKEIRKTVVESEANFNDVSEKTYEYLDQETISILLDSIEEIDASMISKFEDLLPHCNNANKDRIVELLSESEFDDYDLEDFIVFLNNSQKYVLLEHYYKELTSDKMDQIEDLFPLIHDESKQLLVEKVIKYNDFDFELEDLMPFLNNEHKDMLVAWITEHDEFYEGLEDIFPYLNKNQKMECLNWAKNKISFEDLAELIQL